MIRSIDFKPTFRASTTLAFTTLLTLAPYLNVEQVWKDYTGQGVVIAAIGPADHLHPDLAPNYDADYLASYNAWTSGDIENVVFPTYWLGLAAASANNGEGIVGIAHEATVRGEWQVDPDKPADILMTFAFGDPYGTQGTIEHFLSSARGGLGNIILMNSPDTWQSSGDYESGTLHSEYAMNSDRHNITVSGLTAFGYEPHGLGNTHGPMTLVSAPIFTSSYMTTPGGPIPGPNQDTVWTGFGDPLASSDTTTLGLDLSGAAGANDRNGSIGDGWELIVGTWFPELFEDVDSANYTYDASTNAASAVTAGVVGLMLEANPNLGWRDVQEILAYSANPILARPMPGEPANTGTLPSVYFDDVQNGATNWNGGGLWHSAETGFGALDAHGAVRLAETWAGSHASDTEQSFSIQADGLPVGTFPMGDWTDLSDLSDIHKSAPRTLNYTVDINTAIEVEHVSLTVDLSATDYSGLTIGAPPVGRFIFSLLSPNGTESVLSSASAPFDWEGPDSFETIDWTFTTRAFWGEDADALDGEWTIRVELPDYYDDRVDVTIDDLTLNFYGKPADEDDTYIFTEASGLMPLDWTKNDGADDWVVRADTPVLNDDTGRNVINAAAISEDMELSTQSGSISTAAYDPTSPIDYQGDTEYELYSVGTGAKIDGLIAGDGDDHLSGGSENGTFNGMRGDDYVRAGAGDDILAGGAGLDRLLGEGDADSFVFQSGIGLNIVYDFADGEDLIGLIGLSFNDLNIESYRGTGAIITHDDDRMILRNTDASDLDAADFVTLTEEDLL